MARLDPGYGPSMTRLTCDYLLIARRVIDGVKTGVRRPEDGL